MENKIVKPRLSKEDRNAIFNLYTSGMSVINISEKFKVSRPTVYSVIEKGRRDQTKNEFFIDSEQENKDMSNLEKTEFLGITIDEENGPSDPKINKALNTSFKLLNIFEFIEVTKFKLNMTMFDYFWQVIVGNTRVHLSPRILEWFGYEGEQRDQKKSFIKMLKRNEISFNELTQNDKEVNLYPSIKEELDMVPNNVTNSKFILLEPDNIKMAIMQLKTKNGHIIRQYYIDLEKLLKTYTEYTLYFNHRESQREISDLQRMITDLKLTNQREREHDRQLMEQQTRYMRSLGITLEEVKDQNEELLDQNSELLVSNKGLKKDVRKVQRKLGIAVEDRAPMPEDESKRERFVLLKLNNSEYYPYYTIRAQNVYTDRKIKTKRIHFPNLEVLIDFKCNPNSKTLYNRIKENLKEVGVTFNGNSIDLEDTTITDSKRNI